MSVPTEKEFRDAGYTADAINYPLSYEAFALLCKFNGTSPSVAPRAWRYAPNDYVRGQWELLARPRTLRNNLSAQG